MNDISSRRVSLFVGFGVCLFLMCTISLIAFFANHMNAQTLRRLNEQNEARALTDRALRDFGAAQLAVARFRETKDPALEKAVVELVDQAMKNIIEAKSRFIADVQCRLAVDLADSFKRFENDFREEIALAQASKDTQEAKEKRDAFADETKRIGDEFSARQCDLLHIYESQALMENQQSTVMIAISTIVALLVGIAVSFAVAKKLEAPKSNDDDFSKPPSSGDLHVVADKLQEVVNLLRK